MLAPRTMLPEEWRASGGPNYREIYAWRQRQVKALAESPELQAGALEYYRTRPVEFINHWVDTFDPRNAGKPNMLVRMPLVMFQRQAELIQFFEACKIEEENGLLEKARAMGATWTACAYSVHQWLFAPGTAHGWGSRKEDLVDKLGDPDSIFEKIRQIIRGLPKFFWPKGFDTQKHMTFMRVINPANDASITGESGDNIGRGGRKSMYFKDESAHYERPELIEASLSENTRCQIDISSVNGTGNVFYRKRQAGQVWTPGAKIEKGTTRVFIMDWSDNPALTPEWYKRRKDKFEREGLGHIFAQEVMRDYSSSVLGVIIPPDWVNAAIDAHKKLMIHPDRGQRCAALDVADGGIDRNAQAIRRGVVLQTLHEWSSTPDPGVSANIAIGNIPMLAPGETCAMQYDSVGVGAGVKTEYNRLVRTEAETGKRIIPRGLIMVPWSAGSKVQQPKARLIPDDRDSPKNEDYFENMKAQAWWSLRMRFWRTWRAINEGIPYDLDSLISLDSRMPLVHQLAKELSQAVTAWTTRLKMVVDKTPEGTKSPNLADAVVMCYFPAKAVGSKPLFGTSSGGNTK